MMIKNLIQGSPITLNKLSKESKETKPPNRFSETVLAKTLSDLGIGRPATLSTIISIIQERGYVVRKGTQLYPTALGFAVANMISDKLPKFVDYGYTAEMEEELDQISENKKTKEQFLTEFWKGKQGFDVTIKKLLDGELSFEDIKEYSTIDLHNGYLVRFNKFGTFIEDPNGETNAKGFKPSAKIEDNEDLWKYKDAEICKELINSSTNIIGPRELGVLDSGEYKGWVVYAKTGKFGDYLQAIHPKQVDSEKEGKRIPAKTPKPVNHKIPKELELETVELKHIKSLFEDVRLPRWSDDGKWLIGIGKRGPYVGFKKTKKSRPVFKSLPKDLDPRKVSFEEAKKIWEES